MHTDGQATKANAEDEGYSDDQLVSIDFSEAGTFL